MAAEFKNFTLFISFDFATEGNWDVDTIANLTNTFKDEPAQFKVDGKPLVSTFEGGEFKHSWKEVRERVDGDIYFVPDWSGLGPFRIQEQAEDLIDGACESISPATPPHPNQLTYPLLPVSFNTWPGSGQTKMTTYPDNEYTGVLPTKTYMMGVSPYFYTRIAHLNKNWYSSSDSLWYDRWLQVLEVLPDMVQIITWNDYGESHYIGDIVTTQVIDASADYVKGMSHKGFRAMLPYFIAAYKAGKKDIPLPESMGDGAVSAWYRTTPANLTDCSDGETVWGQGGKLSATAGVQDAINLFAVSAQKTVLTVSLGEAQIELDVKAGTPQFFQVTFADLGNQIGKVAISMNGKRTEGPEVTLDCPASGVVSRSLILLPVMRADTNRNFFPEIDQLQLRRNRNWHSQNENSQNTPGHW